MKLDTGGHKGNKVDGQIQIQLYFNMSWACASGCQGSDKLLLRTTSPPSSFSPDKFSVLNNLDRGKSGRGEDAVSLTSISWQNIRLWGTFLKQTNKKTKHRKWNIRTDRATKWTVAKSGLGTICMSSFYVDPKTSNIHDISFAICISGTCSSVLFCFVLFF